ncbi:hypothetical protein Van01_29470 [Micromonospora andamanensis]|uniref:Uncharacterized protein n=1 Tax=Micromonospora andamanensis TaxID=1287068 RepID=A0ABQ4HVQ4_9ACTN|nr:hypothetical protein Van01_29470 [Micromonospora andamanensis]
MSGGEQPDRLEQHRSEILTEERHPELAAHATAGLDRAAQGRVHLLHERGQVVCQPPADGCDADDPTGALEQRRADTPLQFPDDVTDPAGGHAQAFGGTAEVQLVGERQEGLDFVSLQHPAALSLNSVQRS